MKKRMLLLLIFSLVLFGCTGNRGQSGKIDEQEYILLKANNYPGLLKLYRERLQKKEDPQVRYKVANYYYILEDYESSRHFLAPLLKSHPNLDNYHLESKNLRELGKNEEALEAVDQAIKLGSDNGEAYNTRGTILAASGYFEEAINSFNQARSKMLDDKRVMNNIAMVYILKEDYKKALSYLMPMYLRGDKSPELVHNLVLSLIKTQDYLGAENVIRDENLPQTLEQLVAGLSSIKVAVTEKDYVSKRQSTNNANNPSPKENVAIAQPSRSTSSSFILDDAGKGTASVATPISAVSTTGNANSTVVTQSATSVKPTPAPTGPKATISDVRMADNAKGSRLVIESDNEIKFSVTPLNSANQVVVELIHFNPSKLLTNTSLYLTKNHKIVKDISFAPAGNNSVKMVLQLNYKVNVSVYRMKPEDHYKDRVVIDFIG